MEISEGKIFEIGSALIYLAIAWLFVLIVAQCICIVKKKSLATIIMAVCSVVIIAVVIIVDFYITKCIGFINAYLFATALALGSAVLGVFGGLKQRCP